MEEASHDFNHDRRRTFHLPKPIVDGVLTCPGCGCQDFRVTHTHNWTGGEKRRRRVCRHCGWSIATVETPVENQ